MLWLIWLVFMVLIAAVPGVQLFMEQRKRGTTQPQPEQY